MNADKDRSSLKDIQEKILNILENIHVLCEKHEIRYYIIGGTLIGAVRHQGFVPWDDDIDIGMLRCDYDKFLKISHLLPQPLSLQHPGNDETYIFPFAKCYDTSTTSIEKTITPFVRGVWVDIFPLDNCLERKPSQKLHYLLVRTIKLLLAHKTGNYRTDENGILKTKLRSSLQFSLKPIPVRILFRLLERILTLNKSKHPNYVGNLLGRWGIKEISRSAVFLSQKPLAFSGKYYYGPIGYNEYLTKIYGEYMTPPPIEKQNPEHLRTFLDLDLPYSEYNSEKV